MEGTSSSFSLSPSGYVCRGSQVTVSGSVDYDGGNYGYGYGYGYYGQGVLTLTGSDNLGSCSQSLSIGSNFVSQSFSTSNVSTNDTTITINATIDGDTSQSCSVGPIYVVSVTDLSACAGISGTSNIVQQIWGKFAGLSMVNAFGFSMTYYGDYYSSTLAGLVSNGNGDCDAWAQFFQACLNVHKIGASYIQICPDQSAFNIQIKYLKVLYNMPGQNNPNPPRVFNYHAVSIYSNCIYDSSYGNKYCNADRYLNWEDSSIWCFIGIDDIDILDTKGILQTIPRNPPSN